MFLRLDNMYDDMGRHVVCAEDLENGQVAKIKGLASGASDGDIVRKVGIDLGGQAFEVEKATDVQGAKYVLIANDNHRYENELNYNVGDCPTTKKGTVVRAYILGGGQTATVEEAVIDGSVAVGDYLTVKANSYKFTKGTAKTIALNSGKDAVVVSGNENLVALVLEKVTLYGKSMVKLMFL